MKPMPGSHTDWNQSGTTHHIQLINGMDLYLGSTGPTRIATTHSGTMPSLELRWNGSEPIDLSLAFVIDSPGVISVLKKEGSSPVREPSNWLCEDWALNQT